MNAGKLLFAWLAVAVSCASVLAHTEQEYIDKGRMMVNTSASTYFDNEADLMAAAESDDPLYHWDNMSQDGFFGFFVTNGWTRSDCETAFDKYLSWVSTNDMSMFSFDEKGSARDAISQCLCMGYTQAAGTLRTYVMNPTAIEISRVAPIAVRLGGVDEPSATFVETIVTNKAQFSYSDISWAIPAYCGKLLAVDTNNAAAVNIRNRDARLFYANRLEWLDGTYLDDLFVAAFPGYANSSNRLAYANHVLSWTTNNDWRAMHEHFVTITNNLISSGQPLVNLSLDE